MFRLGLIATGGNLEPIRQFVLYENLWLDRHVRVESKGMESLWLKSSLTCGGNILSEISMTARGGCTTLAFALQLRKSTENLSQGLKSEAGLDII
jgi:hypothetical protein